MENMNHDPSSHDADRSQTENDAIDLEQVLAIDWAHSPGWTFRQEQWHMERRRARSQSDLDRANVRCKCGTVATISVGKGPHTARADCPVCGRTWIPKSVNF